MPDRRTKLLRLLAVVDQQIEEAESLMSDATLSEDDRRFAAVQLEGVGEALERVETMVNEPDGTSGL